MESGAGQRTFPIQSKHTLASGVKGRNQNLANAKKNVYLRIHLIKIKRKEKKKKTKTAVSKQLIHLRAFV